MVDDRFAGKSIPTSDFAGDDGQADPNVLQALRDFRAGAIPRSQVLVRLASARLFVPVKALLDSVEETQDGRTVEKDSHMATVSIQTADGRRGLLAFTSADALTAWDCDARPVAARGQSAAAAAQGEGANALVVDLRTDHTFVVEGDALTALASGEDLWDAVADPEIQRAVMTAVAGVARDRSCQFELTYPLHDADVRVAVVGTPGLDVNAVLTDAAAALGENEVLRARLTHGVELGVSPPS
ncbi:MAG: SseB family protein [Candidatus Nanopelagicales bacterium]